MSEWLEIVPKVKPEAEFLEIATDFGDPMEVFREAISNAIDANSTQIKINIYVDDSEGDSILKIEFEDNGEGMTKDQLLTNFWDLGNSSSKNSKDKIGEKGHGTKIYLRSKKVTVFTHTGKESFESYCENPMKSLTKGKIHQPYIREIEPKTNKGTSIIIDGYNNNERSRYLHNIVSDYLNWFTKNGSFENQFNVKRNFKVFLKCLDDSDYIEIPIGHVFPDVNDDLTKLFDKYGSSAADYFVKKYVFEERLTKRPEIEYKAVIYIEGNEIKKSYNPLIKKIKNNSYYKVSDRYGIWLSKDYIPVQRVNDWISGFGKGSGSFLYLHGFINCQNFKLTANRGSIANTDPEVLSEIKERTQIMLQEINKDLINLNFFTVSEWDQEEKTLEMEKNEFEHRKGIISLKKIAFYKDTRLLEPKNESELFWLFISLTILNKDLFPFEPLDYNTSRGIDVIARNKSNNKISDCEFWYIELKYNLIKEFNHSFKYTRWIICWDFLNDIKNDSIIKTSIEGQDRILKWEKDNNNNKHLYFLDDSKSSIKIQVIRLREYLEENLGIVFKEE
jgi:hypothetical protein